MSKKKKDRRNLANRVRDKVLSELSAGMDLSPQGEIQNEDDLRDCFQLDDLDHIELVMMLEQEFQIEINDDLLEVIDARSINDWTKIVSDLYQ